MLTAALFYLVTFATEGAPSFLRRHKNAVERYVRKLPDLWRFIVKELVHSGILLSLDGDPEPDDESPDGDFRVSLILLSMRSALLYSEIQ